jgi:hypothetical protein
MSSGGERRVSMSSDFSRELELRLFAIEEKLLKLLSLYQLSHMSLPKLATNGDCVDESSAACQNGNASDPVGHEASCTNGVHESTWDPKQQGSNPSGTTAVRSVDQQLSELQQAKNRLWAARRTGSGLEEDTLGCRRKVAEFIQKAWFEWFIAFIIGLNAAVIGLQTDWHVRYPTKGSPPLVLRALELVCSGIFTVEIVLRVIGEGRELCSKTNPNRYWNVFDSFLVILTIFDEVLMLIKVATVNAAVVRLFRLLRLCRILRLIRMVRMLHDLRTMVAGLACSMKPLFWAIMLIFLITYMYSVCVLQFVAYQLSAGEDLPVNKELVRYFGSLLQTVYVLCVSVSGGIDWDIVAHPLGMIHPLLQVSFAFYVAFTILCVFNVVTGCFVDKAVKTNALDEERMMMEDIEDRKKWLNDIKKLFNQADADENGYLDKEEFQRITRCERMRFCFKKIGLDIEVDNINGMFEFLDIDGDGSIDVDEFTSALQHLHGSAKSIDMARIQHSLRRNEKVTGQMLHAMEQIQLAALQIPVQPLRDRTPQDLSPHSASTPRDFSPLPAHTRTPERTAAPGLLPALSRFPFDVELERISQL